MAAWGTGLMLIRTHPIFGVGYERFTEFNDITAHNSVVVCSAELGFVGLFFWILFALPTVREMLFTGYLVKNTKKDSDSEDVTPYPVIPRLRDNPYTQAAMDRFQRNTEGPATATIEENPYFLNAEEQETLPAAEIQRLATLMVICFTGFFVTCWFLSRSYVMTLFIYGAMTQVIYRAAVRGGVAPAPLPTPRLIRLTALTCLVLILIVYAILRLK